MRFGCLRKHALSRAVLRVVLASVLLLSTSACGTVIAQVMYFSGGPEMELPADATEVPCCPMVYSGVKVDLRLITYQPFMGWLGAVVGVIDLIPSAVMDTVILPVTLIESAALSRQWSKQLEEREERKAGAE